MYIMRKSLYIHIYIYISLRACRYVYYIVFGAVILEVTLFKRLALSPYLLQPVNLIQEWHTLCRPDQVIDDGRKLSEVNLYVALNSSLNPAPGFQLYAAGRCGCFLESCSPRVHLGFAPAVQVKERSNPDLFSQAPALLSHALFAQLHCDP